MDSVGVDVHKNLGQVCPVTAAGESLPQRIRTPRARLAAVFAQRPTGLHPHRGVHREQEERG
jgi:hypothetical protein